MHWTKNAFVFCVFCALIKENELNIHPKLIVIWQQFHRFLSRLSCINFVVRWYFHFPINNERPAELNISNKRSFCFFFTKEIEIINMFPGWISPFFRSIEKKMPFFLLLSIIHNSRIESNFAIYVRAMCELISSLRANFFFHSLFSRYSKSNFLESKGLVTLI